MADSVTRPLPTEALPAPDRRRARHVTWWYLGGLVVLMCAGLITGHLLAGPALRKANGGPPTPSPSALRVKLTVELPARLGSRAKNNDAKLNNELSGKMNSMRPGEKTVYGIYGFPEKRNLVVLVAVATEGLGKPADEVDALLTSFQTSSKTLVTGVRLVHSGRYGGVAKCGELVVDRVRTALCFWADEGTAGLVWFYYRTPDQVVDEVAEVREQVVRKST